MTSDREQFASPCPANGCTATIKFSVADATAGKTTTCANGHSTDLDGKDLKGLQRSMRAFDEHMKNFGQ